MRILLGILLSVGAAAGPAVAGTISIGISQTAEIRDGNLAVKVTVRNSGDEAAQSVTPVLGFAGKDARGETRPALPPNTAMEQTLTIPVGTLGDGRWPYRLAVDYTDLNQYPFQALEVQSVMVGTPPPAKIIVQGVQVGDGLSGSGDLEVKLKNLTADARTLRLTAQLPEGLEASNPERSVTLKGWAEDSLEVPVTNRTALVGSTYPIFVTAEYDDGPVHHAVIGRGVVKIIGDGTGVGSWRPWLLWGAGALLVAWIAIVFVRTRRP